MLTIRRRPRADDVPPEPVAAHASVPPATASAEDPRPAGAPRRDVLARHLARAVDRRAERPAASLLQRWPAGRVTAHPTPITRIKGRDAATKAKTFATLRVTHTADSHAVIEDLDPADVWGSPKSDITKDNKAHGVRIDRQNPTETHSNVQIQTNGESISLATVLIDGRLANAKAGALKHHIRTAFHRSLDDGMQWEVYDDGRPL